MKLEVGKQFFRFNFRGIFEIINNLVFLSRLLALVLGCKFVQVDILIIYSNDDSCCKLEKVELFVKVFYIQENI